MHKPVSPWRVVTRIRLFTSVSGPPALLPAGACGGAGVAGRPRPLAGKRAGGAAELPVVLPCSLLPASRLDAERRQGNPAGLGRDDQVVGQDAVLLAALDDIASLDED